jgi:3-oxoacyl-[acyl-carrier protein] reductase
MPSDFCDGKAPIEAKESSMKKLDGKVAIVTGASKGIGAAIARTLGAAGAAVVVNYSSNQADADAVVASIKDEGGRAVAVKANVSTVEGAKAIADAALATYGRIDTLVNNAGVYSFAPLQDITEAHFRKMFDVNVLGLLLVTQAVAANMAEGGSIINIGASITGLKPPSTSVYTASKSAAEAITSVLSKELGVRKIRINSLNPGPTETDGTAEIRRGSSGADLIGKTPLGRIGQPDDIAKVALFLASEESAWMTGGVILASGGLQ